ncbi:FlaA1/EpsC-like NDP-sugar epimerase [Sinobacterium caligoides]|uniref:FlaA1/EpsC-like NDP-sugar epimerase n=1 Tax=Sinobacterium caligoides TaxID=933926 RepID=A0A3N2DPT7_9GAMM|nr:nucleoside-diphosphate sugar epimerase/dehydratase [Sinobacterium caligoides]ROS01841.1 FlaA1/EpsC-like NDP-sugar epimerase [Sinobacterium caligoides]
MNQLHFIWSMPRIYKRMVSVVIDSMFIALAFWGAYWARLGSVGGLESSTWVVYFATTVVTLIAFTKLGLYRAILRYLTFHALFVISIGTLVSLLSLTFFAFYFEIYIPRTVPIIYGAFLCLLCGGSRLVVRVLFSKAFEGNGDSVVIYGAGSSGRLLSMALRGSDVYRVRAFIDSDKTLKGTVIQGVRVFGVADLEAVIRSKNVRKVLLALPRASRMERKAIIDGLVHLSVEVLTVPRMIDIVSGKAKIDELRDVSIEDLLGRDPVQPQQALIEANVRGKVVMVTGAGGSIGSELCRQIIRQGPTSLILFELSEFAMYRVDKDLSAINTAESLGVKVVPLLGSVQKENRVFAVMQSFGVQTVYHAAAYKHVPLVEHNVVEGIRNNVFGTYFTAKAAINAGVESFVLISTDKAVRPTNVMGASKRVAELGLQALASKSPGTRFCMVRFGNVLGSSGSVIPLFKKQIAEGGPVTVTHPDIIRYFMTIPEAAQLVIQAGALGKGGDVFVLDMGEPVKISDLAKDLIQLSGLEVQSEDNPAGDIALKFTGLRPGEKLYEELLIGDSVEVTAHERIMTANESFMAYEKYVDLIDQLDHACHNFDHVKIRQLLLDSPTGFEPTSGIGDLVWQARSERQSMMDDNKGGGESGVLGSDSKEHKLQLVTSGGIKP